MSVEQKKKELVQQMLKNSILPTPEIINSLHSEDDVKRFYEKILRDRNEKNESVELIFNYENKPRKRRPADFTRLFQSRFNKLSKMLRERHELMGAVSINRILNKQDREQVSIIGLIYDKQTTKNNNTILTLEDETGSMKVIIHKNSPINSIVGDLVLDEVIGVRGSYDNKVIFASSIIFPDVPLDHELKKSPTEAYAAVISDIQLGSENFLEEEFRKFIKWLKGEYGTENQISMAKKVKYVFFVGDVVDGIGVYPEQEKRLKIKTIREQYEELYKHLSAIPEDIRLIISPGNHDAVRLAEPQPIIDNKFTKSLKSMPLEIETARNSSINIEMAISIIPFAASIKSSLSEFAIFSVNDLLAFSLFNLVFPLNKLLTLPKMRFASVIVGSTPPAS